MARPRLIDMWAAAAHAADSRKNRKAGMVSMHYCLDMGHAAKDHDIPPEYACALFERESWGGLNVIGNDKGGWGYRSDGHRVYSTPKRAEDYLEALKDKDNPPGRQGWGPGQLTWGPLQTEAVKLGGSLHNYSTNMWLAMRLLRQHYDRYSHNWVDAFTAYNGSDVYGREVTARAELLWRPYLEAAS